MVQKNLQQEYRFYRRWNFDFSNVHTKASLEPAGDKKAQVDRIRSWKNLEIVHLQQPIYIDTYILLDAK